MSNDSTPIVSSRPARWEVACLLVGAGLVRLAVLIVLGGNLSLDPDAYGVLAESLARDGRFAIEKPDPDRPDEAIREDTAYRPPVYPLMLTPIYAVSDRAETRQIMIGGLHLVLGVATVYLTCLLGIQLGLGRLSLVAGGIVAADPLLLQQSTLIMTETLAAFFTALLLVLIHRWQNRSSIGLGAVIGVLFGVAILCRPVFLTWIVLLGLAQVISCFRARRRILGAITVALTVGLVLVPWTVRNERVFYPVSGVPADGHRPIYATTHGGYTLLLGNNAAFYDHLRNAPLGKVWSAEDPAFVKQLDDSRQAAEQARRNDYQGQEVIPPLEPYLDRAYYRLASEAARQQPSMFVHASLTRIYRLWTPLPHAISEDESTGRQGLRFATAFWYVVVYSAIVIGLLRLRRHPHRELWLWGLLFCVGLTMLHTFFWSNIRMRAPLVPYLAVLATFGLSGVLEFLGRRSR